MITNNRMIQWAYDQTWGRVFAGAYDRFVGRAEGAGLADLRRRIASQANGITVELATGTALNLPYYSADSVTDLILTEPYPHMVPIIERKVAQSGQQAKIIQAYAEHLPFPDHSVDTVVASMILCSAENPEDVLAEIRRVLKPEGQYLFLEHIRNPNDRVARVQDRVQPAWYLFGNGCHCNRDSVATIAHCGLNVEDLRYTTIGHAWRIVSLIATGRARPALALSASPSRDSHLTSVA